MSIFIFNFTFIRCHAFLMDAQYGAGSVFNTLPDASTRNGKHDKEIRVGNVDEKNKKWRELGQWWLGDGG